MVARALPVGPRLFTYVVGATVIVAGVIVPPRYAEYGASPVAAWLAVPAAGGHYDVAVGDLVLAVGAIASARLAAPNQAT